MSLLGFTTRIDFPTPYFRFSHEAVNERIIDILQEVTSRGTPERPFMCRVYHRPREAKVYVELEAASGRVYLSYAPPGEVKRALTHGTVTEKRDAVAALGLRRERREPLPFEEVKDALFALMEEEKAGGYRGNVFGQLGVYDTPEVRRKMLEVLRESDDWVDRILALGRIAKSKRPDREAVIAEAALRPDQDDRVVATAIQYLCTPTSSRWREVLAELRERGPLSKRVESVAEFCEQRSLRYEELSDPPGANPPAASSRSAASDPVCSRQVPSEDGGAAGNAARDNVQVEGASGLPWLHLALGLGGAAVAGAVGMWLLHRRRAA